MYFYKCSFICLIMGSVFEREATLCFVGGRGEAHSLHYR